eukprot:jgi/Pico_ML_1/53133/g3737.t1
MARLRHLLMALGCTWWTMGAAKEVLVLMEAPVLAWKHAKQLRNLREEGHQVQVQAPGRGVVQLASEDANVADALIVFANDLKKFKGVNVKDVVRFVERGGNLVVAVDEHVEKSMVDLAAEFGIELDARGRMAMDFAHNVDLHEHDPTVFVTDQINPEPAFVGEQVTGGSVVYQGIGMSLLSTSDLLSPLLTGSPTTYSHFPGEEVQGSPILAGKEVVLVAAVQARNNARAVFSGSMKMFSDDFMDMLLPGTNSEEDVDSANQAFGREIMKWALQEKSVLKASNFEHRIVGGEKQSIYRIKDEVEFFAHIEEYSDGEWVPFQGNDVQVEYVMLDPYVRRTMQHNGKGDFYVQMKLPDVYGVFKFVVNYHHPGYSWIKYTERVPARPFRHNEYERFIYSAYPYYCILECGFVYQQSGMSSLVCQ